MEAVSPLTVIVNASASDVQKSRRWHRHSCKLAAPASASFQPRKITRSAPSRRRGSRISAGAASQELELDFSDPAWKTKYQGDFERRFNLPHLRDIFDIQPIPSTFCLQSRCPVMDDFVNGYPSDERWNGYVYDEDRALLKVINYSKPTSAGAECIDPGCSWVEQWVHRAGPREQIYFKPEEVNAAIVTCGGLCPGLNDVIRQIVITLEIYGVKKIWGIPFGYRGFLDENVPPIPLTRNVVQNIHLGGGSILGVSRGGPHVTEIVDSMQAKGINMLFVLGGNGTHAGANEIHKEVVETIYILSLKIYDLWSSFVGIAKFSLLFFIRVITNEAAFH